MQTSQETGFGLGCQRVLLALDALVDRIEISEPRARPEF